MRSNHVNLWMCWYVVLISEPKITEKMKYLAYVVFFMQSNVRNVKSIHFSTGIKPCNWILNLSILSKTIFVYAKIKGIILMESLFVLLHFTHFCAVWHGSHFPFSGLTLSLFMLSHHTSSIFKRFTNFFQLFFTFLHAHIFGTAWKSSNIQLFCKHIVYIRYYMVYTLNLEVFDLKAKDKTR